MKKIIKILFLIFLFHDAKSQPISGEWIGQIDKINNNSKNEKVLLELEKITDSTYSGVIHANANKGRFLHYKVSGFFNQKDSTLLLSYDSIISYKLLLFEEYCFGRVLLKIENTDSAIVMAGIWKDKSKALWKCSKHFQSFQKLLTTKKKNSEKRYEDVQKVIDISKSFADSVKIELYDGGDIDNDSVNVFLNDIQVIKNLRLNATSQVFYFSLNKKTEINKLIFQAINLGDVEPNTAYMVITINHKQYSINLSSSFKKNGVIEFQFIDY